MDFKTTLEKMLLLCFLEVWREQQDVEHDNGALILNFGPKNKVQIIDENV